MTVHAKNAPQSRLAQVLGLIAEGRGVKLKHTDDITATLRKLLAQRGIPHAHDISRDDALAELLWNFWD